MDNRTEVREFLTLRRAQITPALICNGRMATREPPAVIRMAAAIRVGAMLSALVLLAACSPQDDPAMASGDPTNPSTRASDIDQPPHATTTDIRILIAGRWVRAQLDDNPPARAFADQLPMPLSFRDLNGVERIAKLPRPLTTDGVPEGADPDIADIGYYAPTQDLVLYYGDVGYWNGIIRIGRYDDSQVSHVRDQPDGADVTIEGGRGIQMPDNE